MTFRIKNHRLVNEDGSPVAFRQTPNKSSGVIAPTVIVLHDTAGGLDDQGSVDWLCNPQARASAHFVVGREGEITQLCATNAAAWHAGQSSYRGRSNVNGFSVGIEIVNPGKMSDAGSSARAWFGATFDKAKFQIVPKTTREHGAGLWMPYTDRQLEAVVAIGGALGDAYAIADVTTHWAISPGRKVDTNPLFPLENVRGRILGRFTAPEGSATAEDAAKEAAVTIAAVNQRRWPSFADNVIQVVPKGAPIEVLRVGVYANNGESDLWLLASVGGQEGWIHSDYVDRR